MKLENKINNALKSTKSAEKLFNICGSIKLTGFITVILILIIGYLQAKNTITAISLSRIETEFSFKVFSFYIVYAIFAGVVYYYIYTIVFALAEISNNSKAALEVSLLTIREISAIQEESDIESQKPIKNESVKPVVMRKAQLNQQKESIKKDNKVEKQNIYKENAAKTVYLIDVENGYGTCPVCKRTQKANRSICFNCGTPFTYY